MRGRGDLANWHTGKPEDIPAVGAKQVLVMMSLFTKNGAPKLVSSCTYPLTGLACVSRVYTHHGIFTITPDGVLVDETYGTTLAKLRQLLNVPLVG